MSRKKKYEDYDEEFENDEDEIDLALSLIHISEPTRPY